MRPGLIDSQLKHGQWNYECASEATSSVPTGTPVAQADGEHGEEGAAAARRA